MMAVTSRGFHKAWAGIKAKANTLDLQGWMRATAARNGHIACLANVLRGLSGSAGADDGANRRRGHATIRISAERTREIFWNDLRFISSINVLGLPGAVVPVTLHDGKPIGVQLIAGRYREDLALDAAAAIEKRAGMLVRQLWERLG